jgi:hypothetical protein
MFGWGFLDSRTLLYRLEGSVGEITKNMCFAKQKYVCGECTIVRMKHIQTYLICLGFVLFVAMVFVAGAQSNADAQTFAAQTQTAAQ